MEMGFGGIIEKSMDNGANRINCVGMNSCRS